jgi:hypothetical protein
MATFEIEGNALPMMVDASGLPYIPEGGYTADIIRPRVEHALKLAAEGLHWIAEQKKKNDPDSPIDSGSIEDTEQTITRYSQAKLRELDRGYTR